MLQISSGLTSDSLHSLLRGLFPGRVFELGKVHQRKQEVLIKLDGHSLQQNCRILDEPYSVS